MTKKGFLLLFLSLLCSLITNLFANQLPVVVISQFNAKDIATDDVDFVMDTFTTNFASLGVASIVDRSSFDVIKKELSFQDSDWSDNNKVAEMGRALNASQVVVGHLTKRAGRIFLTVKILDVNTTTIIVSHMTRVAGVDDFFDVMPSFCEELIKKSGNSLVASATKSTEVNTGAKNLIKKTPTSVSSPKKEGSKTKTSQLSKTEYEIGDIGPYGGVIFYVSEEGFKVYDGEGGFELCHYFETTTGSIGESRWGNSSIQGLENELGYGKANTYKIISNMPNLTFEACAAYRAYNYSVMDKERGWWLPSKDELDLVYKNLYKGKRRDDIGWCWSSSMNGTAEYVWKKDLRDGRCQVIYKHTEGYVVIAVHAF